MGGGDILYIIPLYIYFFGVALKVLNTAIYKGCTRFASFTGNRTKRILISLAFIITLSLYWGDKHVRYLGRGWYSIVNIFYPLKEDIRIHKNPEATVMFLPLTQQSFITFVFSLFPLNINIVGVTLLDALTQATMVR